MTLQCSPAQVDARVRWLAHTLVFAGMLIARMRE
jgi:hypothetical protein